jgi:hypothetical protein
MKETLQQELAAWKRRLDSNKKNNLQAGILKAETEILRIENQLAEIKSDIKVEGKKVAFNKSAISKLPYNSLLKKVNDDHYIVMYGSSTAKDAEINFTDGQWHITCCELGTHPKFDEDELGLAITFVLERMHDKYSKDTEKPKEIIPVIEDVEIRPKKKTKKIVDDGEDIEELKRYLAILQEIKETSSSKTMIRQITSDIKEVEEKINILSN